MNTENNVIKTKEIKKHITDFVDFTNQNNLHSKIKELIYHLDLITACLHFANYNYDETEYNDDYQKDYQSKRKIIIKNFPELGPYNIPETISKGLQFDKMSVGDSVDDLADIILDMEEVLWKWDNNSEADALWCFTFGYNSHWGKHIRALQLYLHELENE